MKLNGIQLAVLFSACLMPFSAQAASVAVFDIDNIQIQDLPGVVIVLILALALTVIALIYRTRNPIGFYLRKKLPIQIGDIPNWKKHARILFIDDQDVPNARTLKDDGWIVQTVRDAEIDSPKIKDANIIFVDWKDVGRRISSEGQGVTLAENIKRKYRHQKYVILYSVQEFHKPENAKIDDWLNKGSDFDAYMRVIYRATYALFG